MFPKSCFTTFEICGYNTIPNYFNSIFEISYGSVYVVIYSFIHLLQRFSVFVKLLITYKKTHNTGI